MSSWMRQRAGMRGLPRGRHVGGRDADDLEQAKQDIPKRRNRGPEGSTSNLHTRNSDAPA